MSIPNEPKSDDKVSILDLPLSLDPSAVTKRIKFRGDGRRIKEAADTLTKAAVAVARPKALYRTCKVYRVGEGEIDVEGIKVSSRVLNKLFIGQDTAFPYIVTIGPELAEYNISSFDMMTRFWLDNIKEMVLHAAGQSFSDHLQKNYPTNRLTHMNPGEIDDWPITQQKLLFSLLGNAPKQIGVRLTDGGMLNPVKSRSGIYFPNNNGFETCRLCTQSKCPGRRAAYNASTVAEFTGSGVSSS
jgi:hypothetical protein